MKRFRSGDRCGAGTRQIVRLARVLVPAFAIVLLASEAQAVCTPDSATAAGVTATCTGTTNNQSGGAPGGSAGPFGYGAGETGVTVTIANGASVTGTDAGIALGDATVINNAGASITGGLVGIFDNTGTVHETDRRVVGGGDL